MSQPMHDSEYVLWLRSLAWTALKVLHRRILIFICLKEQKRYSEAYQTWVVFRVGDRCGQIIVFRIGHHGSPSERFHRVGR